MARKDKGVHSHRFYRIKGASSGVDRVLVASGKPVMVFNIGHGKSAYRLIAAVHFDKQRAFAPKFLSGTHNTIKTLGENNYENAGPAPEESSPHL